MAEAIPSGQIAAARAADGSDARRTDAAGTAPHDGHDDRCFVIVLVLFLWMVRTVIIAGDPRRDRRDVHAAGLSLAARRVRSPIVAAA